MATVNPIQLVPNVVPTGQTGEVDVTFTLDPGAPDKPVHVTITSDGHVVGSADGVLQGAAGEPLPVVALGSTGRGWEIQFSAGTAMAVGGNKFKVAY